MKTIRSVCGTILRYPLSSTRSSSLFGTVSFVLSSSSIPFSTQVNNYPPKTSALKVSKLKKDTFVTSPSTTEDFVPVPVRAGFVINEPTSVRPITKWGTQSFRKLVEKSSVFVDKSLFIEEFLNYDGDFVLVTYPRRWGKTINLDMVKTFVEMEVDNNGNAKTTRNNDALFIGGEIRKSDGTTKRVEALQISKYPEILKEYMGKYPVIYMNMMDIYDDNLDSMIENLQDLVQEIYEQHEYLLKSPKLGPRQKETFTQFYTGIENKANKLRGAIKQLSKFLYLHHGKPVFLFIDEYDAVFNNALIDKKQNDSSIDSIVNLLIGIYQTTLKSNQYVERAFITGVYRISKSALFSNVNNFAEVGIANEVFSPYYGFTEEEVEKLLTIHSVDDKYKKGVKEWYNGFNLSGYQIYNPWSIVRVITSHKTERNKITNEIVSDDQILTPYQETTRTIEYLENLFKYDNVRAVMSNLVLGNSVRIEFNAALSIREYKEIREILFISSKDHTINQFNVTDSIKANLFSYLFAAGYLTICPLNPTPPGSNYRYLRIPNLEMRSILKAMTLKYFKDKYANVNDELFKNAVDTLQNLLDNPNTDTYLPMFKNEISKELAYVFGKLPQFKSLHQHKMITENSSTASNKNNEHSNIVTADSIIHSNEALLQMVVAYIAIQTRFNKFGLEVQLGDGRTDIVLTNDYRKKAVIIELKYCSSSAIALKQIKDKNYVSNLLENYSVILIGVNLETNKTVEVAAEWIPQK